MVIRKAFQSRHCFLFSCFPWPFDQCGLLTKRLSDNKNAKMGKTFSMTTKQASNPQTSGRASVVSTLSTGKTILLAIVLTFLLWHLSFESGQKKSISSEHLPDSASGVESSIASPTVKLHFGLCVLNSNSVAVPPLLQMPSKPGLKRLTQRNFPTAN